MTVWLVFCGLSAFAEDSAFTPTKAPEAVPEVPETHLTAELGGTIASGNSNFYTVNGLVNVSHKAAKNQVSFLAGLNIGGAKPVALVSTTTGGATVTTPPPEDATYIENVRRFYGEGRYDRFLTNDDSLYVLAGAFHDRYAGYDLRAHEQIGYSRLLVHSLRTELRSELGADWAQEDYVAGTEPNYQNVVAARILVGFAHKFGKPGTEPGTFDERVVISDVVEIYESVLDFEDVRMLNTAALTSTLSGKLSLKLSHSLIFDNVPVEGFEPLDQTTMVTLVASLL